MGERDFHRKAEGYYWDLYYRSTYRYVAPPFMRDKRHRLCVTAALDPPPFMRGKLLGNCGTVENRPPAVLHTHWRRKREFLCVENSPHT